MKPASTKPQNAASQAPARPPAEAGVGPEIHRGRPRAFDVNYALDQALRVFWKNGYEGASLPELTKAMGINRPSLYATFGNKEALFRKAMERYASGPTAYACKALAEPTARAVVERLLRGTVDVLSDPRNPPGCLAVQGALSCSEAAEPIRRDLAARRSAAEDALRRRFEAALAAGDLPPDAVPADLARYVATVTQGMSVQAAGGATRDDLSRVVDLVLRSWPGR
jgi:AcrR family transcriptional regulator